MTLATAPLGGIRVLDTATLYGGPLLATLLADHGAEVVKVEPPAGDAYRGWPAMWALVGRGKRSLTLDLDAAVGADLLRRLVHDFDVVVENSPRRLAQKRGLTPEALRTLKPGLVVVSATGFGHDGPYADRPANGTIGEAFAGLTHLTGDPDERPMLPSVPLGDVLTAAFGAMGALAAVVRQLRSGVGAHVDVTVFEPVLHALGPSLPSYEHGTPPPSRDGGAMGMEMRGTFKTRDARWVAISCSTPRHLQAVATIVDAKPDRSLLDQAAAWIASQPQTTVMGAFIAARIPVTPVNDLADIMTDPHIAQRGSLINVENTTVAAPTPRIDAPTVAPILPRLGDANDDLLRRSLGLTDDEIRSLRHQKIVM
jgi:formyl-CoA transferase